MGESTPIVYVVDDDEQVLVALVRLIEACGFHPAPFSDPDAFLASIHADAHGCVVLDLSMPGSGGLAVQDVLRQRGVLCPVIFLTGNGDIPSSVAAMKGGAVDFLTKPVDVSVLRDAIGMALARAAVGMAESAERRLLSERFDSLTPREHEVLRHVLSGRLNKQIASDIGTVEKTVKVHRSRLMHKLGVRSVAELTRLAGKVGIEPSNAR